MQITRYIKFCINREPTESFEKRSLKAIRTAHLFQTAIIPKKRFQKLVTEHITKD